MQTQIALAIQQLLQNRSTTFAQIDYTTKVKTAAAHKERNVAKRTNANVQLFANIHAATSVFANAVKRSAAQRSENAQCDVAAFTAQSNYFEHTPCYSIVQHKTNSKLYLYAIYNNATSEYMIDGVQATKQQVAQLLTASEAAKLLNPPGATHNVTHNVTHDVIVRTVALENIHSIHAAKQQLQF